MKVKRLIILSLTVLSMSSLNFVGASAATTSSVQGQVESTPALALGAQTASQSQLAYTQEMQREAALCGCNPPCRRTTVGRNDPLLNSVGTVKVTLSINGTGYYPACTFSYSVNVSAGGIIFQGRIAYARWWYKGIQQTTVKGDPGAGLTNYKAVTPSKYYGSYGPQVDNLGTWWAIGNDVETVSTPSDDQYMNENTIF